MSESSTKMTPGPMSGIAAPEVGGAFPFSVIVDIYKNKKLLKCSED